MKTKRNFAPTRAVRVALQDGPRTIEEITIRVQQLESSLARKDVDRVIRRGLASEDRWLERTTDGRFKFRGGKAA